MKKVYRTFAISMTTLMLATASYAADAPNPAADAKAPAEVTAAPAAKAGNLKEICKDDIKSLCADVKPGEWRIYNCLKEHEKKLSEQCQKTLESIPPRGQNHPAESASGVTPEPIQVQVEKGAAKAPKAAESKDKAPKGN